MDAARSWRERLFEETGGRLAATAHGALWMTMSALFFSLQSGTGRELVQHMHPFQIGFFSALFGIGFMLPWLWRAGWRVLRTRHTRLYMARGCLSQFSMFGWFGGLMTLQVGEATAISFITPFCTTALAVLLLGEKLHRRRLIALIGGFAGVLVILRPGAEALNWGAILILLCSLAVSVSAIVVKRTSRDDPPDTIALYQVIYMLPIGAVAAAFVWRWPTWLELALAAAAAAFSLYGQRALARAYASAEATAVQPFDFIRMPFAVAVGWAMFNELPDAWTWAGAAVIFASAMYLLRRERRT
jgi:drug/metabolite transporter (DMT)-like permease